MPNRLDAARDIWASQLTAAARSTLRVDWDDDDAIELMDPLVPAAALAAGSSVRSESLDAADPNALPRLLDRLEGLQRWTRLHQLVMVIGAVQLKGDDDALPLATVALDARRDGRKTASWSLTGVGDLELCPLTNDLLSVDYGVSVEAPNDVSDVLRILDELEGEDAVTTIDRRIGVCLHRSGWLDALRDIAAFEDLSESRLIGALAGLPDARLALRDERQGPTTDSCTVLPSDSSQRAVISRAAAGETLVIEGPPGTGKSQTIVNLLADLVGAHKSVLFVAEKRAAVDVVKERLDEIGLGHLLLDLHGEATVSPEGRVVLPAGGAASTNATLERSIAHHRAMEKLLSLSGPTLRLRDEHLPKADFDTAHRIQEAMDEVDHALRIAHEEAAELRTRFDAHVDVANLVTISQGTEDLASLVKLLDRYPSDLTVDAAIAAARQFRALKDLEEVVSSAVEVSTAISDPDQAISASIASASVRATLATKLTEVVSALEEVESSESGTRLDSLLEEARTRARPANFGDSAQRFTKIPIASASLGALPVAEGLPVLHGLLRTGRRLADLAPSLALLCALEGSELLLDTDEPADALRATIGRALLGDTAIVTARSLDDEAESARDAELGCRASCVRQIVAAAASKRASSEGEVALEGLRRRSGRSVRLDAGFMVDHLDAVLARYPIVVASPWSVARTLPAVTDRFDLVIFDEASQIELDAAVPALARARAAAVFGDSFQLPPNTFFRSQAIPTSDPVLGQVSLLDGFATLLANTPKSTMLRWHYRSIDDRLVSFVAASPLFYGGELIASPSPPNAPNPIRLEIVDRSAVAQSVDAAVDSSEADQSVVVVTFGVNHARSLRQAMKARRRSVEARSIEQMQGDEADVVVLVLPVPDEGTTPLQSLGPINQDGGHRRLNVAVSRARVAMTVISTFGADALDGATSTGARALRDYLSSIAELGSLDDRAEQDDHDGVVAEVARMLDEAGFAVSVLPDRTPAAVRLAVGCSDGRTIAVDVETPALCGLSAHDREIVRAGELMARDWVLHRTAVADWVADAPGEIERLRGVVDQRGGE